MSDRVFAIAHDGQEGTTERAGRKESNVHWPRRESANAFHGRVPHEVRDPRNAR